MESKLRSQSLPLLGVRMFLPLTRFEFLFSFSWQSFFYVFSSSLLVNSEVIRHLPWNMQSRQTASRSGEEQWHPLCQIRWRRSSAQAWGISLSLCFSTCSSLIILSLLLVLSLRCNRTLGNLPPFRFSPSQQQMSHKVCENKPILMVIHCAAGDVDFIFHASITSKMTLLTD
jgi:hypothetical protein